MAKDAVAINIPKPDIQMIEIPIVGDGRLVVHRWSQKAIRQMEEKRAGKARKKKDPLDPEAEYQATIYRLLDGRCGVPATAFKKAAVDACRFAEGVTMIMARGVLFVLPDGVDDEGMDLVAIEGEPQMRRDVTRISMGTADLRYRAEFREWRTIIRVRYNRNVISAEQIVNLFALAGMHVGIGEGRPGAPRNTMDWGRFHVATSEEVEAVA